jgi:GAF domain-containing protein/anti-sigma regulatory factor (Ser/Thr protein kinase)
MSTINSSEIYSDDFSRDGSKYYNFLLATQKSIKEFSAIEDRYSDIDNVLGNLLPGLAEAVGAQGAFIGRIIKEGVKTFLELENVYPEKKYIGIRLTWSDSFQRLIDEGLPRIFDFIDDAPKRLIADLMPLEAYSAILTCMNFGSEIRIVGVFNRLNPTQPFLNVDKLALSSLVEFIAVGLRTGIRRIKELENVQQTIDAISTEGDLEVLLDLVVNNSRNFLSASATSLMLWDKDERHLVLKSGSGLSQEYIEYQKVTRSIAEDRVRELQDKDILWVEDLRKYPIAENKDLIIKERLCSVLSVILKVTDKILGVLNVYSKDIPRVFTQGEKEIAVTFANQARIAIRNHLLRQLSENNLLQMTLKVLQAKDLADGLDQLAIHVVEHFNVAFCHIAIYNEKKRCLEIKAAHPVERKDSSWTWDPKVGTSILLDQNEDLRNLLNILTPTILENKEQLIKYLENILGLAKPLAQCLIIPLRVNDIFLGIITMGEVRRRKESRFDDARVNQAKLMADYAIVIINKIQTHEQQVAQLIALQNIGRKINTSVTGSLKEVLEEIAQGACQVIDADCAVIYPYLSSLHVYDVRNIGSYNLYKKEFSAKTRRDKRSLAQIVIDKKEIIIVDDVLSGYDRSGENKVDVNANFILREKIRSFVSLGLWLDDEPVGVLFINYKSYHKFTNDELDALNIFANQAALSIFQVRLFERGKKNQIAMEEIYKLTKLIGSQASKQSILQQILLGAQKISRAPFAYIYFWDQTKNVLKKEVSFGTSEDQPPEEIEDFKNKYFLSTVNKEEFIFLDIDTEIQSTQKNDFREMKSSIGLPISNDHHDLKGILVLESREKAAFSPDDVVLAKKLIPYLQVAIHSEELYNEIKTYTRLQEGLLKAGEEITSLRALGEILDSVVENVRQALDCDLVSLYTYDQKNDVIGFPPIVNGDIYDAEALRKLGHVSKDSVVYKIISNGTPHFASDSGLDSLMSARKADQNNPIPNFVERERIYASAGIPLKIDHETIGVLFINFRKPHTFSLQERKAILVFATQASSVIYNSHLTQENETEGKYLAALYEVGKTIARDITLGRDYILDKIIYHAFESMMDITGPKPVMAAIYLKSKSENALILNNIYPKGLKDISRNAARLPLNKSMAGSHQLGVVGRACLTKRYQAVPDADLDQDYVKLFDKTKSLVAVPILDNNNVIGILDVEWDRLSAFDENDINALKGLAELAVITIKNSSLYVKVANDENAFMRDQLAADWVHRLSNRLGTISSRISLVKEYIDNQDYRNLVDRNLNGIVKDTERLIDEAKGLHLIPTPEPITDLDIMIAAILNDAIVKSPKKIIPIINILHPIPVFRATRINLINALNLVIDNAVDAIVTEENEEGKIDITVNNYFRDDEDEIEIRISDNGPSLPTNQREQIFRAGFTTKLKGMGYGLWRARNLVEGMGGTLTLEESKQDGLTKTFSFRIPVS